MQWRIGKPVPGPGLRLPAPCPRPWNVRKSKILVNDFRFYSTYSVSVSFLIKSNLKGFTMLDSLCSAPIRNYLYSGSIFVFLGKHPALIREIHKALKIARDWRLQITKIITRVGMGRVLPHISHIGLYGMVFEPF